MQQGSSLKRSGFKRKTYEELKASRKLKKTPKKKAKKPTITKLKKKLWDECRRIVRARYFNNDFYECFTCGNTVSVPHTGHIIASSLCSTVMRYDLDNLRLQCYICNIHKSGNWVAFFQRLGMEYIENLIKKNNQTKGKSYHADWYQAKIEEYAKVTN